MRHAFFEAIFQVKPSTGNHDCITIGWNTLQSENLLDRMLIPSPSDMVHNRLSDKAQGLISPDCPEDIIADAPSSILDCEGSVAGAFGPPPSPGDATTQQQLAAVINSNLSLMWRDKFMELLSTYADNGTLSNTINSDRVVTVGPILEAECTGEHFRGDFPRKQSAQNQSFINDWLDAGLAAGLIRKSKSLTGKIFFFLLGVTIIAIIARNHAHCEADHADETADAHADH